MLLPKAAEVIRYGNTTGSVSLSEYFHFTRRRIIYEVFWRYLPYPTALLGCYRQKTLWASNEDGSTIINNATSAFML